MEFQENVLLSEYTTFKVGGPAKFFYVAKNKEDLMEAIEKAKKENLKVFILGGGSNILASSVGYDGLVIKTQDTRYKIQDTNVEVGAGTILGKLVKEVSKKSLAGMEWAIGIPGTVGGAVYGNAQAFGTKMSEVIKEIEVLDVRRPNSVIIMAKDECDFLEKESIFKKNKNLIILSVVLELKEGNQEEIEKTMKDYMNKRVGKQPLDYPSAGSIFINKGKESSSSLIDRAGLKGRTVDGAMVSNKHAGFIVNTGGTTSDDILELIE
ncbi:UDP-N-acetylmuramate dehydrogenase, partial [Patescibacteria group bacterium]|nr:UDP-N-acetylmuramate dehydrogenase [Patescibacteria group bacterium]